MCVCVHQGSCECKPCYVTKGESGRCWGISMAPPVLTGSRCYRCSVSAVTHYHSKQVPVHVPCLSLYCMCVTEKQTTSKEIYNGVCARLLELVCESVCMLPVPILMYQRVVVAAAENSFYSGDAWRADTLHLPPDSSKCLWVTLLQHGIHMNTLFKLPEVCLCMQVFAST